MLAADERRETHFLQQKRKRNGSRFGLREQPLWQRKGIEYTETAIKQEQEKINNNENSRVTTSLAEVLFEQMMIAIGGGVSDLPISDDKEDGDGADDEDTELGKLSNDDVPGWDVGILSETVQQCMEWVQQMQMQLDKLTQLACGNAGNYFHETDQKCGTTESKVPLVIHPPTTKVAAVPATTTYGELMESLDIVRRKLHTQEGTFWPGSSHMMIGSGKPHTNKPILFHALNKKLCSSLGKKRIPVEPVSFYPCILPPELLNN